ncbi:MAG: RNA polymerase sigma factor [Terracidiphilus sp.]|jgi:RNA polymerase sigma-70 factor, ECF subfamily
MSNPWHRTHSPDANSGAVSREATRRKRASSLEVASPPPASLSALCETQLLAQAKAGDQLAFAQLYALHKKRIYSLCMRMVGNRTEAEDLTQETFLQLHRRMSTFRGDSSFSTWLHRLAVNVVLMNLRKKGLSLISMDRAMETVDERSLGRSFGSLDLTLSGAIDRLALEHAVDDLPAGYRLAFVLHDIEGYDHQEIASALDCSIGNVKSQLHKARLKLRDVLRALPGQEERG